MTCKTDAGVFELRLAFAPRACCWTGRHAARLRPRRGIRGRISKRPGRPRAFLLIATHAPSSSRVGGGPWTFTHSQRDPRRVLQLKLTRRTLVSLLALPMRPCAPCCQNTSRGARLAPAGRRAPGQWQSLMDR